MSPQGQGVPWGHSPRVLKTSDLFKNVSYPGAKYTLCLMMLSSRGYMQICVTNPESILWITFQIGVICPFLMEINFSKVIVSRLLVVSFKRGSTALYPLLNRALV